MRDAVIPDSWRLVRLSDVTEDIRYGVNEPNSLEGRGPKFLRISDVNDNGELTSKSFSRLNRESEDFDRYRLKFGDLLLARSGSVGRPFVVPQDFDDWVFASYFIRFRLRTSFIDPYFAGFFCRSPFFQEQVARIARVVAQPNVNSGEFASMLLPLPPLSEQRYIIDALKESEAIRQLRDEAETKTAELIPAIIFAMFGDLYFGKSLFPVKPLTSIGELDRGKSKHRPRDEASLYGGPYPFLQTGDIAQANGWITKYTYANLFRKGARTKSPLAKGYTCNNDCSEYWINWYFNF